VKNRRIISLLSAGIVLLSVVNVAISKFGGEKKGIARGLTLLDPSVEASAIRIEKKGCPDVMLAKASAWRLAEPYSAEVDEREVLRFIDALAQTPVSDSISDSELLRLGRTRADFDLEDPFLRIEVFSGGKSAEYGFGSKTPAGDGVYVVIGAVDSVFVMPSNLFAAVNVPVEVFRRRSLFSLVPETVSGFAVRRSAGSIVDFARNGESWRVNGADASAGKVRRFLSEVLSASASGFVWPVGMTNESKTVSSSLLSSYGLDPESAVTVTFTGVDGGTDRISFGKTSSDGEVYALVQRGGAVVTVPSALKELALQDAGKYTDARLFPFEASAISAVVIADAEVSCSFSRGKNGGWRMETPVSAPADSVCVDLVLTRLLALSPTDASPSGLEVSVSSDAAQSEVPREAARVKVSRRAVLGELRMEDLRSKEILKIDPVTVRRIVMSTSDRNVKPVSVVYSRDRGAWNVEQSGRAGKVESGGIAAVLSAINPLRAERVERLKVSADDLALYGLETPRLTIAIDQDVEKSVRRNIMIGDRVGAGCFVTVGSSDAVFVISSETAGKISAEIVSE
jgi:hypothetical protein